MDSPSTVTIAWDTTPSGIVIVLVIHLTNDICLGRFVAVLLERLSRVSVDEAKAKLRHLGGLGGGVLRALVKFFCVFSSGQMCFSSIVETLCCWGGFVAI